MVKRLRHRPFTAVTGVQIPLESSCERENEIFERHAESNVKREHADVAQFRLIDFVNKRWADKRSLCSANWAMKHVKTEYADVAQLAEQLICNQQVIGSSPIIGSLDL